MLDFASGSDEELGLGPFFLRCPVQGDQALAIPVYICLTSVDHWIIHL